MFDLSVRNEYNKADRDDRGSSVKPKLKLRGARLLFFLLVLAALLTAGITLLCDKDAIPASFEEGRPVLVIDPGHGGFDGGAVSEDGTKESDINLAIGLKMQGLAELIGQECVMTRTDDSSRTDYADYSEHQDLVRRTELINGTPGAVVFSIHQNCFPTGQPSGAQVLYSSFSGSEMLGKLTHANLIQCLDPQNRRVAEPAPKALYITANAHCPTILVECGFMSNIFDVVKLRDEQYQTALSVVMIASLLQYLSDTEIS